MSNAVVEPSVAVPELVVTRVINAPRERVYDAWTTPGEIKKWWGPHGMTTPVVEIDLRPGGIFRTVMRAPDGAEYPYQGVILEAVRPERVVSTDAFLPGWKPAPQAFMVAHITFEDIGGKTKVVAKALHWTAESREKHEQMGFSRGWAEMLEKLEGVVAGG